MSRPNGYKRPKADSRTPEERAFANNSCKFRGRQLYTVESLLACCSGDGVPVFECGFPGNTKCVLNRYMPYPTFHPEVICAYCENRQTREEER